MNKKIAVAISFLIGAATGSAVTYYIQSSINEKNKDEFYENEVKPARDKYLKMIEESSEKSKEIAEKNRQLKEKMLDTYDNLTEELGYVTDKAEEVKESIKEKVDSSLSAAQTLINDVKENIVEPLTDSNEPNIYFIESGDYGDNYTTASLVYYTNGIIVNENDEVVDDYEELIGKDIYNQLSKLSEQHTDICWVRNDDISTDFEIQLADYDFND